MAFLKAADAIEMAMGIEKSGEAFYRGVAERTQSAQEKALFDDLAEQETFHYAAFSKLGETVRSQLLMTADEWDEYQEYLQATVQSALFEGPKVALAVAEEVSGVKEALQMAVGFEKETMLFFYSLRDIVPDADRKVIDRIIAEEKTHLRWLAGML